MSAASDIRPFLQEADRRRPDLKLTNTAQSCFELLRLTLALAGPDWAFVGKTRDMDGASVTPADFRPLIMTLTRPDGQIQTISIVGLSMDAAFHVPTHRQVKVIANSSANDDPDPDIHGPAKLDPYDINPQVYRWHNPPIPQFGAINVPPMPAPQPVPVPAPPVSSFPYPDENTTVKKFQTRVRQAYEAANRRFPDPFDEDAFRHFTRYGYSCRTMPAQEAEDKHIAELRRDLGL